MYGGENVNIGHNIKQIRKSKGLTQKELGELLGMSQAAIGQFESKKSNLKTDTIEKIASALSVSPADIVGIEQSDYPFYKAVNEAYYNTTEKKPEIIAAHFDDDEYTEDELEQIRQYAKFIKSQREIKE